MVAGASLGREEETSTPAAQVLQFPAVPESNKWNIRIRKIFNWRCFPCMRASGEATSSSPCVETEEKENKDEQPKKPKNKKKHEESGRNSAPEHPQPRRYDLIPCLRNLVREHLPRNDKIKMQEEAVREEEREEGEHGEERELEDEEEEEEEGEEEEEEREEGSRQEAIKRKEVAVEEEKVQEKGKSGSGSWRLSCCCLFALLLLVATVYSTLHVLEEDSAPPTTEDLKTGMAIAAMLVTTAVWTLSVFPTPRCNTVCEVKVLLILIFCNTSLVQWTRAVLVTRTNFSGRWGWVAGLLCPFLLLVLLCSLHRSAAQ